MLIKVCGMRDPGNIAQIAALKPDMMGFIFWSGSPRNAIGIDPQVVASVPEEIERVALFVNAPDEEILEATRRYGIKTVQFHGDETPQQCIRVRERGLKVMKALPVSSTEDLECASLYSGCVDMFVFDSRSPQRGGSGKKFDWTLLEGYSLTEPFLLSGGIGPTDLDAIAGLNLNGMAGLDLNSRFETSPGIKDATLLAQFISAIRHKA